jgi:hypothetical protein
MSCVFFKYQIKELMNKIIISINSFNQATCALWRYWNLQLTASVNKSIHALLILVVSSMYGMIDKT